ncbi:Hypothetical predicted protein [Octopus vulgaris]|uniref:Mutator-like transposase domain-containing protein n=1 Tax=Octopus vulgaris TaxID=6645 RepID=A0AA36AVK6_OCTVU|nr:Hypothetical predicted protein [Octopus vulgaris]
MDVVMPVVVLVVMCGDGSCSDACITSNDSSVPCLGICGVGGSSVAALSANADPPIYKDIKIEKYECSDHVQKRMARRLMDLVQANRSSERQERKANFSADFQSQLHRAHRNIQNNKYEEFYFLGLVGVAEPPEKRDRHKEPEAALRTSFNILRILDGLKCQLKPNYAADFAKQMSNIQEVADIIRSLN